MATAAGPRALASPRRLPRVGALAWLVPVAAFALWAALARTRALDAPLWIDEGISLGIAQEGLLDIPGVLRQDGSPPVYYVLLHGWLALFGVSATSGHAFSALCAVLAVPAAAWAAWRPFGPRAAVLAAGLVAAAPFVGTYADELRMYTLVFLLATVATGAYVRAFVLGSRRWAVGFGVVLGLVCLTHAWGLFLGAAAAVVLVVPLALAAPPERRRLLVDAALGFGVAALVFLPWLPTFLAQAGSTGAPWSHVPKLVSLDNAFRYMLGGESARLVLPVLGLAGVGWTVARAPRRVWAGLLAALGLALATLLIAWLVSRATQPVWAVRYFVIVLAPLLVALAVALDRLGPVGIVAGVVAVAVLWVGKPSVASLTHKSNVDLLVAAVGAQAPPGTVVGSPQPEQVPIVRHELGPGRTYVTPLGRDVDDRVVDWRDALERLRASRVTPTLLAEVDRLRPGQRLLLVQPRFRNPDSPWTRRIRTLGERWREVLVRDPRLRTVARYDNPRFYSRATVAGLVLERR